MHIDIQEPYIQEAVAITKRLDVKLLSEQI